MVYTKAASVFMTRSANTLVKVSMLTCLGSVLMTRSAKVAKI